jgi:hypothetical protein
MLLFEKDWRRRQVGRLQECENFYVVQMPQIYSWKKKETEFVL